MSIPFFFSFTIHKPPFGNPRCHPGTCISSLYHADSFFSLGMCHADRPQARTCFSSVKAFSCAFTWRRWCFEVKVEGCAVLLGAKSRAAAPLWKSDCSRLVPWIQEYWKVHMYEWKEERCGVRKGLLEERLLSLISALAFIYWNAPNLKRKTEFWGWCPHKSDFFFYAGLICEQRSWTSQESRWGG